MGKAADAKERDKAVESIRGIAKRAIRAGFQKVEGIANGTDPDAQVPWSEHSTQVHVALALAGHQQQNERVKQQINAPVAFGVVFMPPRAESNDTWEREARYIDVETAPALPGVKGDK